MPKQEQMVPAASAAPTLASMRTATAHWIRSRIVEILGLLVAVASLLTAFGCIH